MTPVVLVHGGGFDSRCWDRFLPEVDGPVLAVDLPGRGAHRRPLESITLDDCARSVCADVETAGFDSIVLVGHSLAGCSIPGIVALLRERVRHIVFVACTVPQDGRSAFDTLDPEIQRMIRAAGERFEPRPMDPDVAKLVLGNDLDEEQFNWCSERLVPEAPRLTTDRVDLSPLSLPIARTWVLTLNDLILAPEKQRRFAENVGDCPIVEIDSGHMCMVGQPKRLAEVLRDVVR
jgi:pimeloyl-ACP methyl ester carboxylesterase